MTILSRPSPSCDRGQCSAVRNRGSVRATPSSARFLSLLIAWIAVTSVCGQDDTPFTLLFDTGLPSAKSLTEDAVARRTGWQLVPEDTLSHPFSGDAVLLNDKLVVVLRKQGRGAEVYAKATGSPKHRATLGHSAARSPVIDPPATDPLQIIENTSGAVMVQATFRNSGRPALRFRLTTGEAILEIRPATAAQSVAVLTETRHVVVPDYFGDDMVYSGSPLTRPPDTLSPSDGERGGSPLTRPPDTLSPSDGERGLPAENFCLSLLAGGDSIMMSVWQSSEQEVWLTTADSDANSNVGSSTIQCLPGKSIWLAFLESPGLWHTLTMPTKEKWKPPFPAKWRCSLSRGNGVADSWDLDNGPGPGQTGPTHQGPLVVYPIDRTAATPLTISCPTDVMRNTLGVGPCQYILACEGLSAQGDPTPNSVMTWVEKQFELKKEKKVSDDIRERLDAMVHHVAEARTRLEQYAQWAGQVRTLLANNPGSDPFRSILGDLDRSVAAGLAPEASPARARTWAAEVSALIGQDNGLASCQRLGQQLRSLGAVQDRALAKSRMAARRLLAEGRTQVANQPAKADLAGAVQRLAERMLQRGIRPSQGSPQN